ncbi:MAG: hypothetical protein ACREXT_18645 [Gammaproteobacteria bacterium]
MEDRRLNHVYQAAPRADAAAVSVAVGGQNLRDIRDIAAFVMQWELQ